MSHLHYAARPGQLSEVTAEIGRGADIDAIGIHGFTPLMLAAREGHLAIVEILLGAGAESQIAHRNGRTPLHFAAAEGHLEVVRCLVEHGANVDAMSKNGATPALEAALLNHRSVVALLEASGADAALRDNHGKTSAEWLAVDGIFGEDKKRAAELKAQCGDRGLRPPARETSEAHVARFIAEQPSADAFAAKHGRRTLVFGYGRDQFAEPTTDAWVQRVSEILFTPGLLEIAEERHLTGDELADARNMRARQAWRQSRVTKP